MLGGHDQVAFVLAVLVVDDEDHAAAGEGGAGFGELGHRFSSETGVGRGPLAFAPGRSGIDTDSDAFTY
ncbi:hypothetical protein GCM10020366_26200 [Saccharopolyspora gregorii]|uniref:Uncharacterized protein n=1 Tax=Saccharopolyspora gregorii TaxID=33914 RepID=A0ABP6RN35_9PSEU